MVELPDNSIDAIRAELLAGANGLAASARRVVRWRAILLWLAMGIVVLLLILLSDILLRREELGLRVLSLLVWLGASIFAAYRLIFPAWRFAPTPLQVARWIELERPDGSPQLSTAVELAGLPPHDKRYGSSEFRDSALRAWRRSTSELDWQSHLDQSGLRQAVIALAIAVVTAVVVASVWPTELRTALARLTMPWAVYHWPQRDNLQLQGLPSVVALGSEVQIEVIDTRPPLPDKVYLQIRPVAADDGERHLTATLDTVQVGEVAIGNVPSIATAIEVRAVGGDDDSMAWHRIAVVRPPELEQHQFTIHPPSYTRQPSTTLIGRRISLLAGSRVELQGVFSEPLSRVKVVLANPIDPTEMASNHREQTAATQPEAWTPKLAEDGQAFHLTGPDGQPLVAKHSMHWQFSVLTRAGLELLQPERWSIEIKADAQPLVTLQPAELPELTSNATLPLRGRASDDLGLAEVLAYLKIEGAEDAPATTRSLWSAQPSSQSPTGQLELPIDAVWEFADDPSLAAGQQLTVWLEARDTAGQIGRSQPQSFTIRTASELLASIQGLQKQLLEQVRELVDTQRRNSQLFDRNWAVARQANEVQREQLDVFRNVAQVQQAIAKQLDGDKSSLSTAVHSLDQLLEQNQLADTELSSELNFLSQYIAQLAQNSMKSATETTDATASRAQANLTDHKPVDAAFAAVAQSASESQVAALQALESLLDRLNRNESLQQIQHELSQILNQQNALRNETDQLQLEHLAGASDEQGVREMKTAIVADQQGLARRLDDLVQRVQELEDRASEDQVTLRSQLERLNSALTESQASGRMRRATEEIREDNYAAAATTQQQVAHLLRESLNEIGAVNRSPVNGLQARTDDLRRSAKQLSELAQGQAELAEQIAASDSRAQQGQLTQQQSNLRAATLEESHRAEHNGDARLTGELSQAAVAQQRSEDLIEQGEFANAADAARQAAQQLAQAAQQLDERAEQLGEEVLAQQMLQLSTALRELTKQQRPIVDALVKMSEIQSHAVQPEHQAIAGKLAAQQEAVRMQLRDVRAHTAELATFDWTLAKSEEFMSKTIAAVQRFRFQPDALSTAESALRLLELTSAALQHSAAPQPPSATNPPETNQDHDSQRQEESPKRPIPFIASLKLVRSLQQEISDETERAIQANNRDQRLRELSILQKDLAAQMEQLLREVPGSTKASKHE